MSRRDDFAARVAGRVYELLASKEAQARLLRVLRTGNPEVTVPVAEVVLDVEPPCPCGADEDHVHSRAEHASLNPGAAVEPQAVCPHGDPRPHHSDGSWCMAPDPEQCITEPRHDDMGWE